MSDPELTVIVTAHREGRLLRPTLRSVQNAIDRVVDAGSKVELLIMCDHADDATWSAAEKWCSSPGLDFSARAERVAFGESGATRNAAALSATSEFVAFVDGDDLVSSNYFLDALQRLREATSALVLHPEFVVSFGARSLLWRAESTRLHQIDYRDLIRHNLWPASCVTRRSIMIDTPYRSMAPDSGYGPEDWVWNIDTSARGVSHDVVADTVFFYRVRETGGVNNRHSASILPPFDLDGLRRHLPRVERTTDPAADTDTRPIGPVDAAYARLLPLARWSTRFLSWEAKHAIYRIARAIIRPLKPYRADRPDTPLALHRSFSPAVIEALRESTQIEPAISWTASALAELEQWKAHDDGYAETLVSLIDHIRDRAGAVVAVPWVGVGGADTVSLNYAKALESTDRFRGRTVILGTFLADRTRHDLIPGSLLYSHLDETWLRMSIGLRRRFIAQLLVMVRPELVVSVNNFHVIEALSLYARQMSDGTSIRTTLFSFDKIGDGFPTNPITDDSQRTFIDHIDGLLTDNFRTAAVIEDMLALSGDSVIVHRQPTAQSIPALPRATRAYNNAFFTHLNPFRLLWPHRLDTEKRPDVLPRLARELARRGLPVVIDVWGSVVLGDDSSELLEQLARSGVIYRGGYTGGLPALDTYSYHALLLTSQNEGLPLVLVESLLRGLPVIATSVGGVRDIISDGETGLLAAGPDDIEGLANAVERLMDDLDLRRSVIEAGYEFVVRNHSWPAFVAAVQHDLVEALPGAPQERR